MRRILQVLLVGWVAVSLLSCTRRKRPDVGLIGRPSPERVARKTNSTGAVDSLPVSELKGQHVQDIAEFLQSRVPGLRVIRAENGGLSLLIRGGDITYRRQSDGSTVAESAGEPLVVIDGMPVSDGQVSGSLRALNPNDIKSVQVLKDVSSTSSYGMRGAHGVLLITLKKRDQ